MIFSIILIIFFIVAATIAIKAFLSYQKNVQIGLFFSDFQRDIDEAYNSDGAAYIKNYTIPAGVEYVCFINFSKSPLNANQIEQTIYAEVKESGFEYSKNLYLYAPKKNYKITNNKIDHIIFAGKNPLCIKSKNNQVSIKIEKKTDQALVIVS